MEEVLVMILIATALFPPEPVVSAKIASDLTTHLAHKYQVTAISPKPTRPYGLQFNKGIEPTSYKHIVLDSYTYPKSGVLGRLWESFSLGRHIAEYIERNHESIEVVYANVWPLFAQYFLARVCKKFGIPFVIHVQDIYPESLTSKVPIFGHLLKAMLLPMDRYSLVNAASVISISNQMRDSLISTRHLDVERVHVVRNWQDDSLFQKVAGYESADDNKQDDFVFLYLGSISPSAGVELLIHAFAYADLSDARLVIAGGGSDKRKCMRIANSYNMSNIEFIDASPDQVPVMQAQADILLLPLKKGIAATALPSKMTAYMFSAKPIIASVDEPSEVAHIIRSNNCGWVAPPENIKELARVMQQAYSTPSDDLLVLSKNSLEFANVNLTQASNLRKLAQVVENCRRVE